MREESPIIILISCPDITDDTSGVSSHLSPWGYHRPLLFITAKLSEFWSSFLVPLIEHALDILIHDSAYSTGSCVPSLQIQSFVSVPVLTVKRLWHLIINWIKGGISGARWVLSMVTKNYLWCPLKFPGTNGTRLVTVCREKNIDAHTQTSPASCCPSVNTNQPGQRCVVSLQH